MGRPGGCYQIWVVFNTLRPEIKDWHAFLFMNFFLLLFKFSWSSFPRVQLTIILMSTFVSDTDHYWFGIISWRKTVTGIDLFWLLKKCFIQLWINFNWYWWGNSSQIVKWFKTVNVLSIVPRSLSYKKLGRLDRLSLFVDAKLREKSV